MIISKLSDLPADVSEHDRCEVERFMDYLRRVSAAKAAGVPHVEAMQAIYPDVYAPDDGGSEIDLRSRSAPGR